MFLTQLFFLNLLLRRKAKRVNEEVQMHDLIRIEMATLLNCQHHTRRDQTRLNQTRRDETRRDGTRHLNDDLETDRCRSVQADLFGARFK